MATYFQAHKQSGVIIAPWPLIKRKVKDTLAKSKRCVIAVFTEDEALSYRQIRWYKGRCLKGLSDWSGDTVDEWDFRLKVECGAEIFKMLEFHYHDKPFYRPESITSKSKKQITAYIENILSRAITENWPVDPPDPELRSK